MTSADRPRLRALEAFPVEQDGQRLIGLRDPGGFTEQVVLLPIPALDIVSLFDGERSVAEIHEIVQARHGRAAPAPEDIARFAERLDEAGFLQSLGFEARRQAIEEAWLAAPSRPAAHAGGAYADDPDALKGQIDGFFVNGDGPGWPAPRPGAPNLRGLIAPHIDFHRGGPTYGWAYRALVERSDADLFVVLGTCHAGMPDPFAATLKPYDTPLGPAAVDVDFFEALARRYGHDLLASQTAHRNEHSIEFQAVMLRRLLGHRPFTILPVLASFLHEAIWTGADAEANTAALLERVAREDAKMLEAVTASEPTAFFASVAADGDSRRICGLSPIYAFLRVLPGIRGELLRYSQWPDPQGAVTYCAAAFA